jgi:hypothetical protein
MDPDRVTCFPLLRGAGEGRARVDGGEVVRGGRLVEFEQGEGLVR